MTIAGVVDQDIDRAHVRLDLAHGRVDGIEVRDVDDHPVGAPAVQSFKCNPLFFTPHRSDHGVSGLQRGFGKRAAETCAGAGDQENLVLRILHREYLPQRAGRCCLAVGAVDSVEVERSIMNGLIKPATGTWVIALGCVWSAPRETFIARANIAAAANKRITTRTAAA